MIRDKNPKMGRKPGVAIKHHKEENIASSHLSKHFLYSHQNTFSNESCLRWKEHKTQITEENVCSLLFLGGIGRAAASNMAAAASASPTPDLFLLSWCFAVVPLSQVSDLRQSLSFPAQNGTSFWILLYSPWKYVACSSLRCTFFQNDSKYNWLSKMVGSVFVLLMLDSWNLEDSLNQRWRTWALRSKCSPPETLGLPPGKSWLSN